MLGSCRPAKNRAVSEIPDNSIQQEISRPKCDLLLHPGGKGAELDVSSFDNSNDPLICSAHPGRPNRKGPGDFIGMRNGWAGDRRCPIAEYPIDVYTGRPAGKTDRLLDIRARRSESDGGCGHRRGQHPGPDKADEAHKGFHSSMFSQVRLSLHLALLK